MSDDVLAVLTRLEAGITGLQTGQENLEKGLLNLDTRMTGVETRMTGLETRQTDLETTIVRVRTDVMGRIDRLQDAVAAQRDDMFVTFHMQDRTERLAEAAPYTATSSSAQVNIQQHQIARIQANVRLLKGEP